MSIRSTSNTLKSYNHLLREYCLQILNITIPKSTAPLHKLEHGPSLMVLLLYMTKYYLLTVTTGELCEIVIGLLGVAALLFLAEDLSAGS